MMPTIETKIALAMKRQYSNASNTKDDNHDIGIYNIINDDNRNDTRNNNCY